MVVEEAAPIQISNEAANRIKEGELPRAIDLNAQALEEEPLVTMSDPTPADKEFYAFEPEIVTRVEEELLQKQEVENLAIEEENFQAISNDVTNIVKEGAISRTQAEPSINKGDRSVSPRPTLVRLKRRRMKRCTIKKPFDRSKLKRSEDKQAPSNYQLVLANFDKTLQVDFNRSATITPQDI